VASSKVGTDARAQPAGQRQRQRLVAACAAVDQVAGERTVRAFLVVNHAAQPEAVGMLPQQPVNMTVVAAQRARREPVPAALPHPRDPAVRHHDALDRPRRNIDLQ
jgi:hypothetical protein